MKNKAWLFAGLLISGLYASAASAELIIGAKLGVVDYDFENADSDPGTGGSAQIGYEFLNLGVLDLAVEGEIVTSVKDPKISDTDSSFDSKGIYLSLRTLGPVYAIARVGYADTEITTSNVSLSDSGVSTGLGIGFSLGLRFELEYTTYEIEDLNQQIDIRYLTLGMAF